MKHCIALVALWATFVSARLTEQEMKSGKGVFCGNNLSSMISIVCEGIYNNKQKKSIYSNILGNDDYDDVDIPDFIDDSQLPYPFRVRERANMLIPMEFRKRTKGGIVDECCHKACSFWEMHGYCAKH